MGGEDHDSTRRGWVGDLLKLVDENRSAIPQFVDHGAVVHDLLSHIDRPGRTIEHPLDRFYGTLHAGAKRAW